MSPKKLLIDILVSDQRIREYNKNPAKKTADNCIKAYEEAIVKFCEMFDEEEKESPTSIKSMFATYNNTITCEGSKEDFEKIKEFIDKKNKEERERQDKRIAGVLEAGRTTFHTSIEEQKQK